MSALIQSDRVDNVLLEIIIALEWRKQRQGSLRAIMPIFLGQNDPTGGRCNPFPFSNLNRLADVVSTKTNRRAAQILARLGVDPAQIADMQRRSVKQHVDMILKNQGVKLWDLAGPQPLDECAARILGVVLQTVGGLQAEPGNFRFRSPHGAEVLDWLQEAGLMRYSHIFALQNLHSLRLVAAMSEEHTAQVWRLAFPGKPGGAAGA